MIMHYQVILKCPILIFCTLGHGGGIIKRNSLFKVFGLLVIFIIAGMPAASASSVGAYNVVVTPKYVMATAKHSCAINDDYNYHTRVFENYNPATGHWGVLKFEEGQYYGYNCGSSPEGLQRATDTDMDFCLVHGKSHDNRGVYLIPYNGIVNGKKVVNGYFI